MTKELTSERLRQLVSYDPETGVFTRKYAGGGLAVGAVCGTPHIQGYCSITLERGRYLAHRLAWLYVFGRWPKEHVDHINGMKTDNRIANLREATRSQNLANSRKPIHGKNKFKGVYFKEGRWQSKIRKEGVRICIGTFATEEEAHAAYCAAAKRLRGEFARLG